MFRTLKQRIANKAFAFVNPNQQIRDSLLLGKFLNQSQGGMCIWLAVGLGVLQ